MDKAIVKVSTERGYWLLAEIRGLKEGTVVEGKYNAEKQRFDFSWQGQGAMLIVGENCNIVSTCERPPV